MRGLEARALGWRLGLLGGGMAALAIGLMAGISGSQDSGHHEEHREGSWSPALPQAAVAGANAELAEHPLFEPSRQPWSPAAIRATAPTIQTVTPPAPRCVIVGLVSSASQHLALLRDDTGKVRVAHKGDVVAGWRVAGVDAQGVVFVANKTLIHLTISKRRF